MAWIARCLHVPASETQKPLLLLPASSSDEHDGGRACMAAEIMRAPTGSHSLAGSRKVRRLKVLKATT